MDDLPLQINDHLPLQMINHLPLQVIDELASQGFQLMALAKGVLRDISSQALAALSQEQLEERAKPFHLLGLLVLTNNLKEDSADTISKLQQQ